MFIILLYENCNKNVAKQNDKILISTKS